MVEENVKSISFYTEFERILSHFFILEKVMLKGELKFSSFESVLGRFQVELKEDYQEEMNDLHKQRLEQYFQNKSELTIGYDSQAYICRHRNLVGPA